MLAPSSRQISWSKLIAADSVSSRIPGWNARMGIAACNMARMRSFALLGTAAKSGPLGEMISALSSFTR